MKNTLIAVMLAVVASSSAFAGELVQATPGTVAVASSGAVSGSTNAGNAQTINFNTPDQSAAAAITAAGAVAAAREMANGTQTVKNTPAIVGPNLTSSNDTCMGSISAGVSVAGFGAVAGTTWVDDNCKMLKNSRELWNMGMKAASLALMCRDENNREALELTGFVCPQTKKAQEAAAAKAASEVAAN